jgi:hypothetical protein
LNENREEGSAGLVDVSILLDVIRDKLHELARIWIFDQAAESAPG